MGDAVLHLGRVLGRGEDVEVAAFARRCDRDLAFEIEVILTAATEFAAEAMRADFSAASMSPRSIFWTGATQCSLATASSIVRTGGRTSYSTFTSFAAARARSSVVAATAATIWPSCSTVSEASSGSSVRIGAMSFLPGMSAAVTAAITPSRGNRCRKVDALDARMRMRREHERCVERARHGGDIVEIDR